MESHSYPSPTIAPLGYLQQETAQQLYVAYPPKAPAMGVFAAYSIQHTAYGLGTCNTSRSPRACCDEVVSAELTYSRRMVDTTSVLFVLDVVFPVCVTYRKKRKIARGGNSAGTSSDPG